MNDKPLAIAVHGGAGTLTRTSLSDSEVRESRDELAAALHAGHAILLAGGSSVEAVTAAVSRLEDAPSFNAGRGSVLTHDGTVEMEASIMDGASLAAGAASGLQRVKNPVVLARLLLEKGRHVMLYGQGAEAFAQSHGLVFEDPSYFVTERRQAQLRRILASDPSAVELSEGDADRTSTGTVGAVALDTHGNLAAATSTGGMANKLVGRIGDSPIIGAGTYADNRSAAVSTTGHGELFLRIAAAHEVCSRIRHGRASLTDAVQQVIFGELEAVGGRGGLIALSRSGEIVFTMNSSGMYRGSIDAAGKLMTAVFADEPLT